MRLTQPTQRAHRPGEDDHLTEFDLEELLNEPYGRLPSGSAGQQHFGFPPSALASPFDLPGAAPVVVRSLRSISRARSR